MRASPSLAIGNSPTNSTPNGLKRAWKHIINTICSPGATAWVAGIITVFCLACFGNNSELYSSMPVFIFFTYLVLMFCFHAVIAKGKKSRLKPFEKMASFFEGTRCHTYMRFHVLLLGSLMVHQTTFLNYNPQADYRYLIDGKIFSPEYPSARGLPFYRPWVEKNFKAEVSASGTTADGQKLRSFVTADICLTDNSTRWDWQYGSHKTSSGFRWHNPHAEEALRKAFAKAVAQMKLSEISRQSIVLDARTGIGIELTEIGLRLNGTVTVENVRPYFGD